jgi:hypothetical protein
VLLGATVAVAESLGAGRGVVLGATVGVGVSVGAGRGVLLGTGVDVEATMIPEGGGSVHVDATCPGRMVKGNPAFAYPGSLLEMLLVFPMLSLTTRFCTV